MTRPSVDEIRAFLRRENAVIVHFSGCPKGVGRDITYPEDLREVISYPHRGVCCSLVKPGDTSRNTFGSVGIILDITSPESVMAVDPHDAGSGLHPETLVRTVRDPDVTMEKCEKSIRCRVEHNEWVVKDYVVKGLMVLPDREVWCVQQTEWGLIGAPRGIAPAELAETFPDQDQYSITATNYVKRPGPADWPPCTHQDIYGW